MSALLQSPRLSLEVEEQDRRLVVDPAPQCRFCGCTADRPCSVFIRRDQDGKYFLALEADATEEFACSWYLPGVCNAPACVERLAEQSRQVLFTHEGIPFRRLG